MPRVYLDQDALIRLGRNSPESQEINKRINAGELTTVLSTAHWLDTAGGASDDNSRQLARFMDSLHPLWMLERIDLFHLECRSFLDGVPFERVRERAVCRTVTELAAEVAGKVGGGAAIVDSEAFVMHIRRNPDARELFAQSYSTNRYSSQENRKTFRAGKITDEVERKARALGFEHWGIARVGSDENLRLQNAPPEALRALSCEWEATKEYWTQSAELNPNRVRDLFHLVVAMPYTEFIVTYDANLQKTIAAVAKRLSFPVARLVCSLEDLIAVAH